MSHSADRTVASDGFSEKSSAEASLLRAQQMCISDLITAFHNSVFFFFFYVTAALKNNIFPSVEVKQAQDFYTGVCCHCITSRYISTVTFVTEFAELT